MKNYNEIKFLLSEVENLNDNTPNGLIKDADTILADIMENAYDEGFEISGFAKDIFNIYKESTDKDAVTAMFFHFTGVEFEDFLKKCQNEITREEPEDIFEKE